MANPFQVIPQADITQGLSGLSAVLKENRDARKQQEINDAAQAEIQEALQSNDPMKLAQLSVKFPQLRESIENVTGIVSEQQKREFSDFLIAVATNPDNAEQLLMRRIENLESQNRDPSQSLQSLADLGQNRAAEISNMRLMLATMDPEASEALDAKGDSFTLAPGARRFGPGGEEIAANIFEGAPEEGFTLASGARRFGPGGEEIAANIFEGAPEEGFTLASGARRFGPGGEEIAANIPEETAEVPKEPTSGQRLAAGFAERTEAAGDVITELGEQFTGVTSRAIGIVPTGRRTEDRQLFDQAVRNFINATLRRESGAAIAPSEFVNADLQYIPQPGDKEKVLEQKQKNRETITASLALEAGSAFGELHSVLHPTVIINGTEYDVGEIIENDQGDQGRVEADGSITRL